MPLPVSPDSSSPGMLEAIWAGAVAVGGLSIAAVIKWLRKSGDNEDDRRADRQEPRHAAYVSEHPTRPLAECVVQLADIKAALVTLEEGRLHNGGLMERILAVDAEREKRQDRMDKKLDRLIERSFGRPDL